MAVKTFPYAVIYKGKLYAANTEIIDESVVEEENEAIKPNKKAVNKNDKRAGRKA